MQMTYTFAIGFDMDKYLADKSAVDFIVGDAAYFQTGAGFSSTDEAVPENVIADIDAVGGITAVRPHLRAGVRRAGVCLRGLVPPDAGARWYTGGIRWTRWSIKPGMERIRPTVCWLTAPSSTAWRSSRCHALTVLDGDLSALSDPDAKR